MLLSLENTLSRLFSKVKGCETELVGIKKASRFTRFADSVIHQNTADCSWLWQVRQVLGKRVGRVFLNGDDFSDLKQALQTALSLAKDSPENPDFVSLPAPDGKAYPEISAFDPRTAAASPLKLAKLVKEMADFAKDKGAKLSGVLIAQRLELGIKNSLGIEAFFPRTILFCHLVGSIGERTSYSQWAGDCLQDFDHLKLAEEAVYDLEIKRERELPPGTYEVILEPYGVANLLYPLLSGAFSAKSLEEGNSCLEGKLGEKILDTQVSIWDDATAKDGLPVPFDFEGVRKQKVQLIEKGIARGVVYDSFYAQKAGRLSTGHFSLLNPEFAMLLPANLFFAPGEPSLDEMIKNSSKALLVKRLNYIRLAQPKLTLITGSTRDGVYLIEKGEKVCRVKNLRFTQSVMEALNNLKAIGRDTKLVSSLDHFCGASVNLKVPAIQINEFNFTGNCA